MITDLYGGFHSHGTSIAGWFISSEDNMDYSAVPLKKHQFLNRLFWVDEAKFGHTQTHPLIPPVFGISYEWTGLCYGQNWICPPWPLIFFDYRVQSIGFPPARIHCTGMSRLASHHLSDRRNLDDGAAGRNLCRRSFAIYLSIYLYIYMYVYIYLSIYLIYVCIYIYIYLSICLSIYLSIYL